MAGQVQDLPVALPPGQVAIKTADGTAGTIDQSQVDSALDDGATLVTPDQIQEAKKAAEYNTPGMAALAAAGGAASTVTLGLSDQAGAALGGEKYINAQKYNPTARLVGEGAGFLAPWAADSLAERAGVEGLEALGGAPRAISEAGGLAERGVGSVLEALAPEAQRGLATQVLSNALQKGAGVGLEGALYGAGQSISEDALDGPDSDLTAEKMLANMEKGALFAGGLGAAGGALVPAGRKIASYLGAESGIGALAEKKAGEIAWRSAGGTKAMARGAEHFANGPEEVGKIWIKEAPELAGEANFRSMTRESLQDASTKGMQKYGGQIGDELAKVDAIAAEKEMLPKVADIHSDITAKINELKQKIGTQPAIMKLQGFADDLARLGGLTDATGDVINADARATYSQIHQWRQAADQAWAGNAVDPALFGFKKDFHDVRGLLEKRIEDGAQNVAKSAGEDFITPYKDAKKKFQAFRILEKASDSGQAAQASNNMLGLNARLSSNAGAVAGAMLGHVPGAVIGGGLGAAGGHYIKTRGDFLAADLLSQLGQLKTFAKVSDETGARILGAASSFVHSPEMIRAARPALMGHEEFQHVSHALQTAANDPAGLQQRLEKLTGPMTQHAPQLAQAVSTKATAGVMFLSSKLPVTHGHGNLLQLSKGPREVIPSPIEIESFQRYLTAFEDPESVLDDMRAGRITREGVETVQTCYPGLFQQMQTELTTSAADPSAPELSYEKLVQMGVMFGVPTTEFLQPDTFAAMQANFTNAPPTDDVAPQPQDKPLPETTKRPLELDTKNLMSATQESASAQE